MRETNLLARTKISSLYKGAAFCTALFLIFSAMQISLQAAESAPLAGAGATTQPVIAASPQPSPAAAPAGAGALAPPPAQAPTTTQFLAGGALAPAASPAAAMSPSPAPGPAGAGALAMAAAPPPAGPAGGQGTAPVLPPPAANPAASPSPGPASWLTPNLNWNQLPNPPAAANYTPPSTFQNVSYSPWVVTGNIATRMGTAAASAANFQSNLFFLEAMQFDAQTNSWVFQSLTGTITETVTIDNPNFSPLYNRKYVQKDTLIYSIQYSRTGGAAGPPVISEPHLNYWSHKLDAEDRYTTPAGDRTTITTQKDDWTLITNNIFDLGSIPYSEIGGPSLPPDVENINFAQNRLRYGNRAAGPGNYIILDFPGRVTGSIMKTAVDLELQTDGRQWLTHYHSDYNGTGFARSVVQNTAYTYAPVTTAGNVPVTPAQVYNNSVTVTHTDQLGNILNATAANTLFNGVMMPLSFTGTLTGPAGNMLNSLSVTWGAVTRPGGSILGGLITGAPVTAWEVTSTNTGSVTWTQTLANPGMMPGTIRVTVSQILMIFSTFNLQTAAGIVNNTLLYFR